MARVGISYSAPISMRDLVLHGLTQVLCILSYLLAHTGLMHSVLTAANAYVNCIDTLFLEVIYCLCAYNLSASSSIIIHGPWGEEVLMFHLIISYSLHFLLIVGLCVLTIYLEEKILR